MIIRKTLASLALAFALTGVVVTGPLALTGCAVLGLPTAETFNQRASLALDSADGALDTVSFLLKTDKLSAEDADNLVDQIELGKKGVDIAKSVHAADAADGEERLSAIRAGLKGVIAYLEQRKQ